VEQEAKIGSVWGGFLVHLSVGLCDETRWCFGMCLDVSTL